MQLFLRNRYATLSAKPKFPNVSGGVCYVAPIVSMTHLLIFSANSFYSRTGWDGVALTNALAWRTTEVALKEPHGVETAIGRIREEFLAFLLKPINDKWGETPEARQAPPAPDEE